MSSVEGSGREEGAGRAREEYLKKESELVKSHKKELRKVTEANMREIDNLRKVQNDQISNMRSKSQETMTLRDQKHLSQMEKLRAMHHNQLQKVMRDNEQRMKILSTSAKSEIHQATLGKEDRTNELKAKQHDTIKRLTNDLDARLNDAREQQTKALAQTRTELNERHREEREASKRYNDTQRAETQGKLRIARTSFKERLKNKEIQHFNDKQRMSQNYMANMNRDRKVNSDNLEHQKQGFQDSLEKNREQFHKHFEKDAAARNEGFQQLKTDVNSRINSRVGRLEEQINDIKHESSRKDIEMKRDTDRYVNKMRDSYQEKMESLEDMRKAAIQANNDQNHKNIKDIRKETSDLMENNSRYYISRMETENFRNRSALKAEKNDNKIRSQVKQELADSRVENIRTESDRNLGRMAENFKDTIEASKRSAHEEKREQMTVFQQQRADEVQRMKERFIKQASDHEKKESITRNKFESKIAELNDRFTKEKRLRDQREKTTLANISRQNEKMLETQKIQFQDKMNKSKAVHERELATVQKRHREEMDSVLRTIRQQSIEKA